MQWGGWGCSMQWGRLGGQRVGRCGVSSIGLGWTEQTLQYLELVTVMQYLRTQHHGGQSLSIGQKLLTINVYFFLSKEINVLNTMNYRNYMTDLLHVKSAQNPVL